MQSSGVGNCVNAFTLVSNCRMPFLALVAMRGEFGETNAWQVPAGKTTAATLELAGFHVLWARKPEDVGQIVDAAADMVWRGSQPVAILLSQQLVGAKQL
jgi:sulfopyruvate decarboxylase TPP-binding subunit